MFTRRNSALFLHVCLSLRVRDRSHCRLKTLQQGWCSSAEGCGHEFAGIGNRGHRGRQCAARIGNHCFEGSVHGCRLVHNRVEGGRGRGSRRHLQNGRHGLTKSIMNQNGGLSFFITESGFETCFGWGRWDRWDPARKVGIR